MKKTKVPQNVPIVHNPAAPAVFCDGLSGALVQGSILQLHLDVMESDYSTSPPREIRKTAVTLIMPVNAAGNLAKAVLDLLTGSQAPRGAA